MEAPASHPVPHGPHHTDRGRRGTSTMVLGTVTSAVGAYLFQVIGARALGADAFAPVSVMWTVLFLGFTVFLIPVEQLVIRRLTLGNGQANALTASWPVIAATIGTATLMAVGFAVVARQALLDGQSGYILVAAAMFPGHGLFVLGRGFLAGRGRFVAYGVAVGLDAIGKLAAGVAVVTAGLGPVALAWALVLSPVLILAVRPFAPAPGGTAPTPSTPVTASDGRFMTGFLVANAASQTVLGAGPLVVGALGATSAAISVFFVTTTLFRGPMSASYHLIARVLPTMTRSAAAGDPSELSRWARRLGVGGAAACAIGGITAAVTGPLIVEILYGSEFRPSRVLAGLAGAAVVAGVFGLATTQILVARGHTGRLALVWLVAAAAGGLSVLLVGGDPTVRVAAGFLVGEGAALIGLTVAATRLSVRRVV